MPRTNRNWTGNPARSRRRTPCWTAALVSAFTVAFAAPARGDTVVTTYVTRVQEERESTRFTLTEWLRIKERMRMMDLWLAMFSNPDKDQFRPELNLSYGMMRGGLLRTGGAEGDAEAAELSGTHGQATLWLTNLVSSTFGVRTLNIDLGVEGSLRTAGGSLTAVPAQVDTGTAGADSGSVASTQAARSLRRSVLAGTLRLFGRHIQDSSLVLKYGEYRTSGDLHLTTDELAPVPAERGVAAGAELCLYLFRWLGAEGRYWSFGDTRKAFGAETVRGSYYDYMAFIEISLLRLMAGPYVEQWTYANDEQSLTVTEGGLLAGAKLQL